MKMARRGIFFGPLMAGPKRPYPSACVSPNLLSPTTIGEVPTLMLAEADSGP
jgi:hypothetical protein